MENRSHARGARGEGGETILDAVWELWDIAMFSLNTYVGEMLAFVLLQLSKLDLMLSKIDFLWNFLPRSLKTVLLFFPASLGPPNHWVHYLNSDVEKHPPTIPCGWLGDYKRGNNVRKSYFHIHRLTLSGVKCVNLCLIAWFLTLSNLSLQGSLFQTPWYRAFWIIVVLGLLLPCPCLAIALSWRWFCCDFDRMLKLGYMLRPESPRMSLVHRSHFKPKCYCSYPVSLHWPLWLCLLPQLLTIQVHVSHYDFILEMHFHLALTTFHHYIIIQSSFNILKIPCASIVYPFPPLDPLATLGLLQDVTKFKPDEWFFYRCLDKSIW